jgi:hypothetical protein
MLEGAVPHSRARAYIPKVLTFLDGSGTARKIWHGCRSPVSSPDSGQTARTKAKIWGTEHGQKAHALGMRAYMSSPSCSRSRDATTKPDTKRALDVSSVRPKEATHHNVVAVCPEDPRWAFPILREEAKPLEATYGSTRDVSQAVDRFACGVRLSVRDSQNCYRTGAKPRCTKQFICAFHWNVRTIHLLETYLHGRDVAVMIRTAEYMRACM